MAARATQQTAVAPLGLLVRESRERLHLTQQELATRIGVSRSAISELEAGRIEQPRATVFARLGKALGLPAAALLAAAGYPESEVIMDIEADEIALLAASLAQLAGNERDWLRARLVELRELLVLRRSHRLFGVFPPQVRQRAGAPARLQRLRARRRALERSFHHALQDRGDPEEIVGEIEIPMLYLPAAGALAV